jgi:hypothetical protein
VSTSHSNGDTYKAEFDADGKLIIIGSGAK